MFESVCFSWRPSGLLPVLAGLKVLTRMSSTEHRTLLPSVKRGNTLQICYVEGYSNPSKIPFPHWDKQDKRKKLYSNRRTGINMAEAFVVEPSILEKSTGYAQQQEDFC